MVGFGPWFFAVSRCLGRICVFCFLDAFPLCAVLPCKFFAWGLAVMVAVLLLVVAGVVFVAGSGAHFLWVLCVSFFLFVLFALVVRVLVSESYCVFF